MADTKSRSGSESPKIDKHNQEKMREVLSRISRVQKSRLVERAIAAQAGNSSLSRGEITVTYLARPRSPVGARAGVIVMDPGGDRDMILEGDLDDLSDGIWYGDKDPTDNTHRVDKDGRDWGF